MRVKARKAKTDAHGHDGDGEILHLLRPDAQARPLPVAAYGEGVAAQVIAEDEAQDILEGDAERDGGDGRGEGARRTQRLEHDLVVEHARRPRHEEGQGHARRRGQSPRGIGDVAREGPDGGVRGHGEVGKAQHRVDGGEADGGHGEHRAGHEAVEEQLQGLVDQRRTQAIRKSLSLPFSACS